MTVRIPVQSFAPMKTRFSEKQGQYLAFIHTYTLVMGRPPAEADWAARGAGLRGGERPNGGRSKRSPISRAACRAPSGEEPTRRADSLSG